MRLVFRIFIAVTLLTGCSREKKDKDPALTFTNNMELDHWASIHTIKRSDNAHSGQSVSIIDSLSPYSLGITKILKDISNKTIDSIKFNYWVLLKNASITKAVTVFTIEDPTGKTLLWIGPLLKPKVKESNKWMEITETFKIPKNTNPVNILKLFVWNPSKEEAFVDDFTIKIY